MWLLVLSACAGKREPQVEPPVSSGQHVSVELPAGAVEPEVVRMRAVLDAANPSFQDCYAQALARDPRLFGEVTLRVVLDAQGGVSESSAVLSTLSDAQAVACVEGVVADLSFPAPSRTPLAMRYPVVFTSSATPPEVRRALMLNNGLLTLEQEEAALEKAASTGEPVEGDWVQTW